MHYFSYLYSYKNHANIYIYIFIQICIHTNIRDSLLLVHIHKLNK